MREPNKNERCEMVRAMETIVRHINCEDYIDSWLMVGVADGDINEDTTNEDLEYYIEDAELKDLMTTFLKCIWRATQNGGLFCDGVVSGERKVEWV